MPQVEDKLHSFAELIHRWNSRINLTGYKTVAEIEKRLIGESAAALRVLPISGKRVLDFGSGAGIPGLVWAICDLSAIITSLEIRQKKIAFQKEAVRTLGLQTEIIAGRFPDAVQKRVFDVIVSRAIRFSPKLWDEASPLLSPEGCMVRFAQQREGEKGWTATEINAGSWILIRKAVSQQ